MQLIAATKNKGKVAELRAILGDLGYEIVTLDEAGFGAGEVEETGDTFEQNALSKALGWQRLCEGAAVIADDSGLEVDALGGAPGIYSARYCEGTDKDRRDKLLTELSDTPKQARAARFVCAVCCVLRDGTVFCARGTCEGSIAFAEQGTGGFGYDSLFIEKTTGKSFGELTESEKDAVSHRGNALRALAQKMKSNIKTDTEKNNMTSKQRAKLRSIASTEQTILHVGKSGISENLIAQAAEALLARELVKGTVLETSTMTPQEAAAAIAQATDAEVVQTIGRKFVLYKRNEKEPVIEL